MEGITAANHYLEKLPFFSHVDFCNFCLLKHESFRSVVLLTGFSEVNEEKDHTELVP